jgi:pimeloyl-ACP methyl ester carboxylesterase
MAAPLVFLPGLLEDATAFEHQAERLRRIAPCTVADLTRSDTIAGLARSAIEQAPAGRFAIAGHSMGGYVALEILRQAPARIERVALLNTHARPDTPESTENRRRLMALAEKDFPAVIAALMPRLMTEAHLGDDHLTGIITGMALVVGKEAFARQERAIIGRIDSRPHLGKVGCPALVVAARSDILMPVEILEEMASAIPGARLEVIEDCGHMASLEQPERVADLLVDWMETQP